MTVSARAQGDAVPSASACRVLTDREGRIVEASENTRVLLNSSVRSLAGRPLHLFIAHDRPLLLHQMEVASRGHHIVIQTILRPKERRPRPVLISIQRLDADDVMLEWLIELI